MHSRFPPLLGLILAAVRRLFADEALPLAGNIAFRSLFSIFPFLIFLTALAGFFGDDQLAARAVTFLLETAPEQIARPLAAEIHSILTVPRAGLLSLAALLTIWSAMGGVDSVRVGLNRAYDLREGRSALKLYVMNTLFIIGAAAVLIAFSFLMIFVPFIVSAVGKHMPGMRENFTTLEQLRYPLSILLLFAALHIAHRVLPAKRLPPMRVLPGVALTVAVWIGLTIAFSQWLLRYDSFSTTYASLGGLFAAMFFVYLAAIALILGGEINRVLEIWKSADRLENPKDPEPGKHPENVPSSGNNSLRIS
jgi:membrane protein